MKSLYFLLSALILTGCQPKIGPHNMAQDCLAYNHAIHHCNDSQLLLNIVRLRYRETPTYLQVGVISSAYEFKKTFAGEFKSGVDPLFKAGMDLTEKPTTTFSPVRGEVFAKEFLAPVSFESITLLNSSGWAIDRIMRCCIQRMNNLKNAPSASGPMPSYAPEYEDFQELMAIFHEFEKKDGIGIVVLRNPETDRKQMALEIDPKIVDPSLLERAWALMGVAPGTHVIRFIPWQAFEHGPDEVMLDTRSPLSILYFLSHGVNVPDVHERQGLVTLTFDEDNNFFDWDQVLGGLMSIHYRPCSPRLCRNSCDGISVVHCGYEYFIHNSDLDSKSTFALVSELLTLHSGCPAMIPALTLPIN